MASTTCDLRRLIGHSVGVARDVQVPRRCGEEERLRIAFLADIHANLEAFTACLADLATQKVDRIVFLGDVVGYGADPKACLDIVREKCALGAIVVRGNHDEAMGETAFSASDVAAKALAWTQARLAAGDRTWLANLPMQINDGNLLFVHASASRSGSFPYIHGLRDASESLTATTAFVTLVGHVHEPALYHISAAGKVMGFIPIVNTGIPLSPQRRWLAVIGSVGQPRDGNPAAAYGILDTKANEIFYVRVPYDIEGAAAKIRAAGVPDSLWQRLSAGR
jgi:diadenosine tetraphosphatase ApaH/serine/threonine PP2A family protein phosphatase